MSKSKIAEPRAIKLLKATIKTQVCQTVCGCCEEDMSDLVQDESGVWCHDFDDGFWTPCDASDILNLECWGD